MLWYRELSRTTKKGLQRQPEGENAASPQPSTIEEYLDATMGNLVSAYVELERRLPKEDGEAFYNALCLIEKLLRKGHQDITQGERNQAKRATE